jgi:hypothetical protein
VRHVQKLGSEGRALLLRCGDVVRCGERSAIVVTEVPIESWYAIITRLCNGGS